MTLYSQEQDTTITSLYNRNIYNDESKENIQKSIDYFTKITCENPDDLEAFYNLGMSFYKLADSLNFSKSIEVWDQLIEKYPCFNYALKNRGLCKFFLKDREGACKDFKRAVQCDYPNMSEIKKTYEELCK